MDRLNEVLQELGISKVKLAKYLGVSRQMVYNYLVLDSLDKWPKEKKVLLLQLLNIKDGKEETINKIVVNTEYLMEVEKRLNMSVKTGDMDSFLDLNGLSKESKTLLSDITFLLKEKLSEEDDDATSVPAVKYLYYMLQSMENVPEIKYILGYMAKTNGFIKPDEFVFDEDKQFIFEGILYSALTLYNNGGASKSKLAESHKRFIQEIEQKNEEKLSRTQQLNTVKIQALRELGYTDINANNATEVFEKIAEIQSRKV
ncbi:MAG: helix-turn-helix domain-containing protein [Bacilli bacterium]|nr:helix-turn-helix domain-containing protein [Bacilli bacterium]